MDVQSAIQGGLKGWTVRVPPASPEALRELSSASPFALPVEYLALLGFSNGGEGELGVEPGWFMLWPAEEVTALNRDYEVPEFLPGFLGFGSNGGGEMLAFDLRGGPPYKVAMVPFIPMEADEAVTIAASFPEFLKVLGRVLRD